MRPPFTVHIMTANLAPGDAIGNYILTQKRLFESWGLRVQLYADAVSPGYPAPAKLSEFYEPHGRDILWYHYSIMAENIARARTSTDYKIMDFHGVSPPSLFTGRNAYLEQLCQQGLDLLPELTDDFQAQVVHSDYARDELTKRGYAPERIFKLPLVVDTSRFGSPDDAPANDLTRSLSQIEYLLFVGRLVPQKDILALLDIFAQVHQQRPETVLMLVGSPALSEAYERQINQRLQAHKLAGRVLFGGQVNNPRALAQIFQHARLLVVTSEWESFCVPLVEAMYFGVPPVVHEIPPLPEVGGAAALVIDKADHGRAAQQIVNLLENQADYGRLSKAARERATHFTEAQLAEATLAMWQTLFLGRGTRP